MQINEISEYQLISNVVLEFLPSIQTLIALEKRSSAVKKNKQKNPTKTFLVTRISGTLASDLLQLKPAKKVPKHTVCGHQA